MEGGGLVTWRRVWNAGVGGWWMIYVCSVSRSYHEKVWSERSAAGGAVCMMQGDGVSGARILLHVRRRVRQGRAISQPEILGLLTVLCNITQQTRGIRTAPCKPPRVPALSIPR